MRSEPDTFFTADGLRAAGYTGYRSVASLFAAGFGDLPTGPGTYMVLRPATSSVTFPTASRGGWFKGENPTVSPETLKQAWCEEAAVVYIGQSTSLRTRIRALVRFGHGKVIGHWGGRYLWQVAECYDFVVAWKPGPEPRATESALIARFVEAYGQRPFANLVD